MAPTSSALLATRFMYVMRGGTLPLLLLHGLQLLCLLWVTLLLPSGGFAYAFIAACCPRGKASSILSCWQRLQDKLHWCMLGDWLPVQAGCSLRVASPPLYVRKMWHGLRLVRRMSLTPWSELVLHLLFIKWQFYPQLPAISN
jgi:hypothetical protein